METAILLFLYIKVVFSVKFQCQPNSLEGFPSISAVDFSSEVIDQMKSLAQERKAEVSYLEMDVRNMKFEDNVGFQNVFLDLPSFRISRLLSIKLLLMP